MTAKQTSLYWRTWSALCTEFDWRHNDSARRYALHLEAGCPKSSKDWDNKSIDRYLAHSRALLAGTRTGNTPVYDEDGARRRLEWRIKQDLRDAGLDLSYVAKLATDMYGLGCWSLLSLDQLENLRDTVHNRTRSRRAARKAANKRPAATRPQSPRTAPANPVHTRRPEPVCTVIDGAECPF
jgi:hypothetical protein